MEETVEIKLPISGKTVAMKGYITGRIDQEIQNVFLSATDIQTDGVNQSTKFSASCVQTANNRAIELIVISVDGDSSDILNRVLDMHKDDTAAIVEKVNEISGSNKPPKADSAS